MTFSCKQCGHRFGPDASDPPAAEACPRCGTPIDARAQISEMAAQTTVDGLSAGAGAPSGGPRARRSLGEYDILEEISRGAMGVVYKARHKSLGRIVALKVMIAGEHASPEQVTRFEKEARAAARLRHHNIVPIYEIGVEDGKHFFTMDFIEGTPLDALLARGELPPRRSLEIAFELTQALAYAHSRHVIHRDIKPGNIMIDAGGRPQIMDFGLAKQVDTDTKFTKTGTTIGTPSYMSPEQARGENDNIDFRSDVYSLGAVIYEMLTGHAPFTGETMMNIVMKVIHDEPVPPRRRNPKLHRDLQTIVLKAMEKEPGRRYQTMAELGEDLRRYTAGEMISARPAGPLRRVGKTLRHHRAPILVGLVIAVLVSAVAGAIIHVLIEQAGRERARREEAERERRLSLKDQEPGWVVQFKDDFSEPTLDTVWKPSGSKWRVKDGALLATTDKVSSIQLRRSFEGTLTFEFRASAPSANARISCFLGSGPRAGYGIQFGRWDGNTLSLYRSEYRPRRREVIAQVRCPPIQPGTPYRFRIERRNTLLVCRVTGGGATHELRYDDPGVLKRLGRTSFGFEAVGPTVRFDDIEIRREEFAGPRLNVLQFVEFYILSRGQLARALQEYNVITRKHRDKIIAVVAEYYSGLIQEALGKDPKKELPAALRHYETVERRRDALQGKYRQLALKSEERMFFVKTDLLRYGEAADGLAAWCRAGHTLSPGTAWQFPAILSRCADDGALAPALRVLESARFGGPYATLRDCWRAAGPSVRRAFADALIQVCRGFAAKKQCAEMKRAFLALPDPRAAKAFESVVTQAVAAGDAPTALEMLAFSAQHGMTTSELEKTAETLAKQFLESKQYTRIGNVHTAYPTRRLLRHFATAVIQLSRAGKTAEAVEILAEACRRFPEDKRAFRLAGDALLRACAETGRDAELRRAYGLLGDPRMARWLVDAAGKRLRAADREGAYAMIEYIRENVSGHVSELARLAGELAAQFARARMYESLIALAERYPAVHLPAAFTAAITAVSKTEDRDTLCRLLTQAAAKLPADPKLSAAVRAAARALFEARMAPRLLQAYEAAARSCGENKSRAASVLRRGGALLLGGKAYVQAAAAYTAAAEADPENQVLAASALVRAAVIWDHLAKTQDAQQIWLSIMEKYADATAAARVAGFMAGQVSAEELQKANAADPKLFGPGEADFYLGFRAAIVRDDELARTKLKVALAAAQTAWFAPIAQAAIDALPEPEPEP